MHESEPTLRTSPEQAAVRALRLGGLAVEFAQIERAPRYSETRPENNAEHSFMLALVAPELAAQLRPDLDLGLVTQFSLIHDLIELETGDVVTFGLSEAELASKEATEHANLERLLEKLPAHTGSLVRRYEAQKEPEARFPRLVDKLLPLIANILGPGKAVMDALTIDSVSQLREVEAAYQERLHHVFPEAEFEIIHEIRDILALLFEQTFETQIEPTALHE